MRFLKCNAILMSHALTILQKRFTQTREYLRGKYPCTIDLLFDCFGNSCMTTVKFCFYLKNRLIQSSQTGGQQYSDTSPSIIPCSNLRVLMLLTHASFKSHCLSNSSFQKRSCKYLLTSGFVYSIDFHFCI